MTPMTFLIALQQFIDSRRILRPHTHEYYVYMGKSVIRAVAIAGLADRPLTTIQAADMTAILLIIDDPVHFPGLGDSTKQKVVKALRCMFNWFCQGEWITTNPTRNLRFRKTHSQPTKPYRPDEVLALLSLEPKTPSEVRDRCLCFVLADSGIRCEEARNLRVDDWKGDRLMVSNGKGGKPRLVSLGQMTMECLQEYVEKARPVGAEDHLFLTASGRPMTSGAVAHKLNRWAAMAGVQNATPHRFRATFATSFVLKEGGNLLKLQVLLGHSTLDMSRHYVQMALAEEACLTNGLQSMVDGLLQQSPVQEEVPILNVSTPVPSSQTFTTNDNRNALLLHMIEQNNALIMALIGNDVTPSPVVVPGDHRDPPGNLIRETRLNAGNVASSTVNVSGWTQFNSRRSYGQR